MFLILYLPMAGVMISALTLGVGLYKIQWNYVKIFWTLGSAPFEMDSSGTTKTKEKVKCFSRRMFIPGCSTCKLITSQEKERRILELVQKIKSLATMLADLSSNPETYLEGANQLLLLSSDLQTCGLKVKCWYFALEVKCFLYCLCVCLCVS